MEMVVGIGRVRLEGEIDRTGVEAFAAWAARAEGPLLVDLGDAEVEDGAACGELVRALRQLAERGVRVKLLHAPQVLAHVIYRVGMLGSIELIEPLSDEPSSS